MAAQVQHVLLDGHADEGARLDGPELVVVDEDGPARVHHERFALQPPEEAILDLEFAGTVHAESAAAYPLEDDPADLQLVLDDDVHDGATGQRRPEAAAGHRERILDDELLEGLVLDVSEFAVPEDDGLGAGEARERVRFDEVDADVLEGDGVDAAAKYVSGQIRYGRIFHQDLDTVVGVRLVYGAVAPAERMLFQGQVLNVDKNDAQEAGEVFERFLLNTHCGAVFYGYGAGRLYEPVGAISGHFQFL